MCKVATLTERLCGIQVSAKPSQSHGPVAGRRILKLGATDRIKIQTKTHKAYLFLC